MAATDITVVIKAQLQRDRGLLAALKSNKMPKADMQNSGYGTEAQIMDLERKIVENERVLKVYENQ